MVEKYQMLILISCYISFLNDNLFLRGIILITHESLRIMLYYMDYQLNPFDQDFHHIMKFMDGRQIPRRFGIHLLKVYLDDDSTRSVAWSPSQGGYSPEFIQYTTSKYRNIRIHETS